MTRDRDTKVGKYSHSKWKDVKRSECINKFRRSISTKRRWYSVDSKNSRELAH